MELRGRPELEETVKELYLNGFSLVKFEEKEFRRLLEENGLSSKEAGPLVTTSEDLMEYSKAFQELIDEIGAYKSATGNEDIKNYVNQSKIAEQCIFNKKYLILNKLVDYSRQLDYEDMNWYSEPEKRDDFVKLKWFISVADAVKEDYDFYKDDVIRHLQYKTLDWDAKPQRRDDVLREMNETIKGDSIDELVKESKKCDDFNLRYLKFYQGAAGISLVAGSYFAAILPIIYKGADFSNFSDVLLKQ